MTQRALILTGLLLALVLVATPAAAQQTGAITGTVTSSDGQPLPGVTIQASGDVLPLARTAITGSDGTYRFQLLPPGIYELSFTLEGMGTESRELRVLLDQTTRVDVSMGPGTVTETISVIGSTPLIDTTSTELKAAIDNEVISRLPVGQEYRDLIKLIPGVQYTEDSSRGPSAGGSGQDNVYLFDGVNVGLPLFGVLSAEPSSHDIEQIAIVKGGAKALDFNRSGGFTINTLSKSGTNAFKGDVSYQLQTDSMTSDRDTVSDAEFEQDRDWAIVSVGGPVVRERLFFYTSYYRPTVARDNRANLYGEVPNFDSTRDELFGKLSLTPADNVFLSGSFRDSSREVTGSNVGGEATAGTASTGSDADLEIAILEGSWVISPKSFLGFKVTDYADENASRPDTLFGFDLRDDGSVGLDVNALDTQGLFQVPVPIAGQDAFNAFIQPLIGRYGFVENGVPTGGGLVGGGSTINEQDFFRESYEVSWDYLLGDRVTHDLHFGYQRSKDEEDLARKSNGWGFITVTGGRFNTADGVPYFYEARFQQQSLLTPGGLAIPPINSQFETQSFEVNDTIAWGNWAFNVGLMASNDELFGQGLRKNPSNVSGFELADGNTYKMYEVDFDDMIAPRLGATWNFKDFDTVYANYARYYPAASSLPRAASWARNNVARIIDARFDAAGNLVEVEPVGSSSGKFFQPDLDPRSIDEYLLGYSTQISRAWTGKAHARYRYGSNFWEDTNNNARIAFNPPAGIPRELYIPELDSFRAEVGGSSYVIAELDDAFTKYYEVSLDAEYRKGSNYLKSSYVWSHYYGNFDQDNTTVDNDQAIFIGSSNLADGAGRQIWDDKYGNLRGDRRHQLKVYGYHNFPWNGNLGAFAIFQSGQPWEAWDSEVYRALTSSTSDTIRFAEPAGSRTTSDHYQLDLNYTHNFRVGGDRYNIQLRADLFNVFDKQTGYDVQPRRNLASFGEPRSFFDPRRLQLLVRFSF
ncbi:MAG TPA: carboxypeptidase regulatory-like domain-containing protein [Thermoanaerobaculia bacterium]|nr:carboxypeptidase regulatory-like domain-containing protein [Thermoanaerobaculia bacterium]